MKRLIWLLSLVVIAQCAGFAQSPNAAGAQAATVLNLKWGDLIPKLPPFEDPFKRLTQEQLGDLSDVARVRARVEWHWKTAFAVFLFSRGRADTGISHMRRRPHWRGAGVSPAGIVQV